jgi:hypothetical protein
VWARISMRPPRLTLRREPTSAFRTDARLQRGATWCVRNGASSVHVLASTPGPQLGALFVGKIGRLRAPDNRSEWSSGWAPEDPVGTSRHFSYFPQAVPGAARPVRSHQQLLPPTVRIAIRLSGIVGPRSARMYSLIPGSQRKPTSASGGLSARRPDRRLQPGGSRKSFR